MGMENIIRAVRLDNMAKAGGDRWLRVEPLDADGNLCPPADIAATVWQHPSLAALG